MYKRDVSYEDRSKCFDMPHFIRTVHIPDLVTSHILDHAHDDHKTLLSASTVSHSWRRGAAFHLFRELKVTAYEGHGMFPPHTSMQLDFTACMHRLRSECKSIVDFVRVLYLQGPSTRFRVEGEAGGIHYSSPDLDICIVREFLELLPRVHSLHVENVYWDDCFHITELDCLSQIRPRPFRSISLSRVSHYCNDSTVLDILRCASSLDDLALQSLHRLPQSLTVPPLHIPRVSLYRTTTPYRLSYLRLIPSVGRDTITSVDFRDVGVGEMSNMGSLIAEHRGSLEHIGIHMESEFTGE